MNKRNVQKLFGIPLFYWGYWDDIDVGELQFYDVHFLFPSMEKYNGSTIDYNLEGKINIYNDEGTKIIWEGYACDIPEFMEAIKK